MVNLYKQVYNYYLLKHILVVVFRSEPDPLNGFHPIICRDYPFGFCTKDSNQVFLRGGLKVLF